MSDKFYQENAFDNFVRPPCAQQSHSSVQQYSYSMPMMTNNGYNMQSHNLCDFMYGSQAVNRNQATYTPTSFLNCPDQLDTANWVPDPRVVADIERGLKFSDKMETIEITSKDLSPASCCSNLDLLIPDFYKSLNKDVNFYSKTAVNDSQWYCNIAYNNQKYLDYPSCSQVNAGNNFMAVEEKSVRYFSGQASKSNEFDNTMVKSFAYSSSNNTQYMQYEKNVDKTYIPNQSEVSLTDCNVYSQYDGKQDQLFNLTDLNNDQFYPPNSSLCNEPLSFVDINNLDQPTADGSNDESDIIVEESEDEVTDYSEDLERRYDYATNCIVCNVLYTPVGSQFYVLNAETPLTMSSQKPVFIKLTEMIGTLDSKRNYLCSQCLSLINTIDHLQLKLETSKFEFYSKYEKTCKENNVTFTTPTNCQVKSNESHRNPKTRTFRKFKHFCGIHSFKCKLCKKLFSIKKLYENHILKHRLKNRFLCELCGQRFTKFTKFKSHLKLHSKATFKKPKTMSAFMCEICTKPFRTKSNLKEHSNYCSGNLPYACKHANCDKKFATATKLKNHTKLKHDQKFVAICSICNIGFVKVSDYKSHKITHSTEKKFSCTKCEKTYKTMSNLNYHMKFHEEKLPFVCTICSKGFMRKEYLESHVNNHNGVKNYSCNFCSKKFVSQKNLDAHLKYHEGNVKKKVCNICNKLVTTGFEEHLRTHGNLREFECEVCQMKFNTKGALAKHKKRKHT